MPRLPGPEALGALQSMRPSGPPAKISGNAPVAEGIGRIGAGMVALSNEQRDRDEAVQAAEADSRLTIGLADLRRRFEDDTDHETFGPRFQEEAAAIRAEASSLIRSPSLLRRWNPRADTTVAGSLDQVLGRARTLRSEAEYDRLDGTLGDLVTAYVRSSSDDDRAAYMGQINEIMELGRRTGIVPPSRLRELNERHVHGAVEADANARHLAGDGFAALMELREGDARATQPSTGQVSELGVSNIQRLLRRSNPPPPNQTAQQAQAELRRLRTEAGRISQWMGTNLVGEDGQPIALTQLQHDALVGFALSRRSGRPEDHLEELLPEIRGGTWENVAAAMRAGGMSVLESPAPSSAPGAPPSGPGRPATDDMTRYMAAISSIESGSPEGNYGLVGPRHPTLGRALGRYQVMEANLPQWLREAGQQPMTADQFLASQEAQDAVFRHRFGLYLQRYGNPTDAAQAWFAGPGSVGARGSSQRADSLGTTVAEYRRRFEASLARGQTPPGTQAPPADPGAAELGDMILGRAPSSRYASLPLDRRQTVIRRLSEALRTEAMAEVDLDIASIRQTGQPRRLPDGSSWLDRAPHIMTPMQAARVARLASEARAQFAAISGLSQMTPAQRLERVDSISSIGDTADGTTPRLRSYVASVADQIGQLQRTNSAQWASGAYIPGQRGGVRVGENGQLHTVPAQEDLRIEPAPEVVAAHRLIARRNRQLQVGPDGSLTYVPAEGQIDPRQARPQTLLITDPRLSQEDRRLIIEARLAAAARVEVNENDRRILLPEEMAALLNLPQRPQELSPEDLDRRLRGAADRAMTLFGPAYARAAFLEAWRSRGLNEQQRQAASSLVESLPMFANMSPGELERLRGLPSATSRLSQEEALWRYGTPSTPFGPDLGFMTPPAPPPRSWWQGSGPPDPSAPYLVTSDRWAQAPPLQFGMPGAVAAPGVRATGVPGVTAQAWPRPEPEDIQDLLADPRTFQQRFDAEFGPGAAARYLQQQRR